jgi:hypothetical protein
MKSIKECKEVLSVYSGGPVVLAAGRDAVAHAEALLEALRWAASEVEQHFGKENCDAAAAGIGLIPKALREAIAQAEAVRK